MSRLRELLCFQLGCAARKVHKYYNAQLGRYGITIAQSFILFALLEEEGLNVKTLGERLVLESSAITGLLDRLEKEGLVVRQVDPEDRRAFRIFLTPSGRALAEKIFPITLEFNEAIKGALQGGEQQALQNLLQAVEKISEGS